MTNPPVQERLGLARRYRPRTFAELTGQKHVSGVLRRAVLAGNIPQQLLFSGGSGLGKTTVARICAAAILCETPLLDRPDGDACGHCEACLDVTGTGRDHPDVIEFDAASHGGKDEIRDIAARAALAPLRADRKIYIIDEAHGLSGPGGQAFLKLLEEPPSHVVFMLATTDPQKMLKTNRSRCTEFELLRPPDGEIRANLHRVATGENWTLSDRVADAVIASTDPALGVRGTLMTLQKLAGTLMDGIDPDDAALAELLGVAPSAHVAELAACIQNGDRLGALTSLTRLRERVSDGAVRTALLAWARKEFMDAARGEGVSSPEMALHRYEILAAAPTGEVWTECTVARLAVPALQPDAAAMEALLGETRKMISDLDVALAGARSENVRLTSQEASAPVTPSAAPVAPPVAPTIPRPAPATEPEVPVPAAPIETARVEAAPVEVAPVEAAPEPEPVLPPQSAPVSTPAPQPAPEQSPEVAVPVPLDDPFADAPVKTRTRKTPQRPTSTLLVPPGVDLGWGEEAVASVEPVTAAPAPTASAVAAPPPSVPTPPAPATRAPAAVIPPPMASVTPPTPLPAPSLVEEFLTAFRNHNAPAADFLEHKCTSLVEGETVVFLIPQESLERVKNAGLGSAVSKGSKAVGISVKLRPQR